MKEPTCISFLLLLLPLPSSFLNQFWPMLLHSSIRMFSVPCNNRTHKCIPSNLILLLFLSFSFFHCMLCFQKMALIRIHFAMRFLFSSFFLFTILLLFFFITKKNKHKGTIVHLHLFQLKCNQLSPLPKILEKKACHIHVKYT